MPIARIDLKDACPGDILVFNREGPLAAILSKIIQVKVPLYDRWGWHVAPIIAEDTIMDAQWPRLKLSKVSDYLAAGRQARAYRIADNPPDQAVLDHFIKDLTGCRYDWLVYVWTAFAILLRPWNFPRIVNRKYDCWETAWEFADYVGSDITHDFSYPFLCDMLELAGEC